MDAGPLQELLDQFQTAVGIFIGVAIIVIVVAVWFWLAEPKDRARAIAVVLGLFLAYALLSSLAGRWGWTALMMALLSALTPVSLGVAVIAVLEDLQGKQWFVAATVALGAGQIWVFYASWPPQWWQLALAIVALVVAVIGALIVVGVMRARELDEQQRREEEAARRAIKQREEREKKQRQRAEEDRRNRERQAAATAARERERKEREAKEAEAEKRRQAHQERERELERRRLAVTEARELAIQALRAEDEKLHVRAADLFFRQQSVLGSMFELGAGRADQWITVARLAAYMGDPPVLVADALDALESRKFVAPKSQGYGRRRFSGESWEQEEYGLTASGVAEVDRVFNPALGVDDVRYVRVSETARRFERTSRARPEVLSVLYLTTNPRLDLGTEQEVREIQEQVKGALHRDLVRINFRPAAKASDLLSGLNDHRPHVVHLSGHAGKSSFIFHGPQATDDPEQSVKFHSLASALQSTDHPPKLLVLNGCETMDGAKVFLDAVPFVVATEYPIPDDVAVAFAVGMYGAISAGQSIASAVKQGNVRVSMETTFTATIGSILAREGMDPASTVLVKPIRD